MKKSTIANVGYTIVSGGIMYAASRLCLKKADIPAHVSHKKALRIASVWAGLTWAFGSVLDMAEDFARMETYCENLYNKHEKQETKNG